MDKDEVISEYTDQQAIDDGVLVPLPGLIPGLGPINRVTRAVFVAFVGQEAFTPMPVIEIAKAIQPLLAAIRAMLAIAPDNDGWRTGTYQGRKLWAVPNEVGGLTLMFPEDY